MNLGGKSRERLWLLGLLAALALVVGGPVSEAYAQQGIAQNLEDSFELHGYVENQEIIRAENYVSDYNVAPIRNRIDLQPSGQIISDATLPTVLGVPLGTCVWRIADLCRKSAIRDTHVAEARAMAAEQGRIAMAALGELAPSVYRESLAALIDEQLRREVFTPAPLG